MRAAYQRLGGRQANNLVRRSLRAAIAPVREAQRAGWLAEPFARGSKYKKKRGRRRKRPGNPVIVRKAIARAVAIRVDRESSGRYVAAVGIDYSRKGLRWQHRFAHILERGRSKRRLRGRLVNQRVNMRMAPIVEREFVRLMQEGMARAVA